MKSKLGYILNELKKIPGTWNVLICLNPEGLLTWLGQDLVYDSWVYSLGTKYPHFLHKDVQLDLRLSREAVPSHEIVLELYSQMK